MSLGALAAAASLAAAAVPSNSTQSPPYTLTHIPQSSVTALHHSTPQSHQDQSIISAPQPANSAAERGLQSATQLTTAFAAASHSSDHRPSSTLNPVASAVAPHVKVNAKPVAPAPSSAMHSPQQQVPSAHPNGKPKQRRYRASPEQLRQLVARFDVNPSPSSAELQELAAKISMPTQSVVLWFKNRRARVPHKKVEKVLHAKRRENGEIAVSTNAVVKPSKTSQNSKKSSFGIKKEAETNVKRSPSFTEEAAAASMAEMAMALATTNTPTVSQGRQPGRNITNQGTAATNRAQSFAFRSLSRSPPPLYRPKGENVVPYDSNLVKKLGSNAGAEFVQASLSTPRRPRIIPPTPRLLSQREYGIGEGVEVLETAKGICRSWYSATVVGQCGPRDLSLGASAAVANGYGFGVGADKCKGGERGQGKSEEDGENVDGGDSPRTVRSPAASPTPPIAKVRYVVEFEHRFEDGNEKKRLREEVLAARIRPAAPFTVGEGEDEWRPEVGEAVEVLRDGAWFVAVVQKFVIRKGYMVSFESGDAEWVRRPGLRPYQIWRGGESWVTKMKAPLPVVMKSVGLSVTHPPGGKRKRAAGVEVGRERETRGRGKRSRCVNVDGSGPDGLPEGWRIDQVSGSGVQKLVMVYVAPDGQRLKSLKEAQRYVEMMGPA